LIFSDKRFFAEKDYPLKIPSCILVAEKIKIILRAVQPTAGFSVFPASIFFFTANLFLYIIQTISPYLAPAPRGPRSIFHKEKRSMNKSQLIEALAKDENLTLKKAEMVVNAIFENMAEALVKNERIEIRGFGSFKVKFYNGYKGRNPKTGDIIEVGGKKLPFFKVGKELGELVDS
jgi:integration host factor subunit beta